MKKILIFVVLTALAFTAFSQKIAKDSLVKDIKQVAKYLNQTHPDPFSAYGNQIEFYREVKRLTDNLPDEGLDTLEFFRYLAPLLSHLGDAHTGLFSPKTKVETNIDYKFPINFSVANDCVFVSEATEEYQSLIGYKLTKINGLTVDAFINKLKGIKALENPFHEKLEVIYILKEYSRIHSFFGDFKLNVSLEFIDLHNKIQTREMEYIDCSINKPNFIRTDIKSIHNDTTMLSWKFANRDKSVAYLQIDKMATREALEQFSEDSPIFKAYAKNLYQKLKIEMPEGKAEILKNIPSLTEMSFEVLKQMKKNKSEYLVVDLRKNSGGNSICFKPLMYMMYGDRIFNDTTSREIIIKVSELLLKRTNTSLDEYNKSRNSNFEFGDYNFWSSKSVSENTEKDIQESKRNYFNRLKEAKTSTYDILAQLKDQPLYTPKVILLVSPNTFSAAYDMVYSLLPYNVITVGVTPGQAGNTYMDGISFTLPVSGLKGRISKCKQVYFPYNSVKGKELTPDYVMNWNDFKKYNFDVNAELFYVLDLIQIGKL